jgi:hypothetical protein
MVPAELARFDLEAGGFNFLNLFLRRLAGRGDADIGKGAWHEGHLSE